MATSGQIQTNTAFGYVRLAWVQNSQSVEQNSTTISYTLSIYRSGSVGSSAAKIYSIKFNGITVASGTTTIGGSGTKVIKSGTVTIPHNSDGSKTFSYSFSLQADITWSGVWIGTISGDGSGTINTIPRSTEPVLSSSNVFLGDSLDITLNRSYEGFTHDLTYVFGNESGTIETNVGTFCSWDVPLSIADQIPNATSGTATIVCKTYNGTTLVGSKSVSVILSLPESITPIINGATITDATEGLESKFGTFVRGKSALAIDISAMGDYASTINTYSVAIRDSNDSLVARYTGSSSYIVTDVVPASGAVTVEVSATDSRGRSSSMSYSITVLDYEPPKIYGFSAFRCNSGGTADYNGAYLNCSVNFNIFALNNLNDKYYEIVYRTKGSASWQGTLASGNIYSRNSSFITSNIFGTNNAYDLSLRVWDYFTDSSDGVNAFVDIPSSFTLVDMRSSGKGIEFGAASNEDCFGVSMPTKFRNGLNVVGGELKAPNIQSGKVSVTPSAANTPTYATVEFPVAFETVPVVMLIPDTVVPATQVTGWSISTVTASGFRAYVTRTNTTKTNFQWLAIST